MTTSLNIRNLPFDKRPTVRIRAITRPLADERLPACLHGTDAIDARSVMLPGETPDMLFLRLWLFYRYHTQQQDSDSALYAAMQRAEAR